MVYICIELQLALAMAYNLFEMHLASTMAYILIKMCLVPHVPFETFNYDL